RLLLQRDDIVVAGFGILAAILQLAGIAESQLRLVGAKRDDFGLQVEQLLRVAGCLVILGQRFKELRRSRRALKLRLNARDQLLELSSLRKTLQRAGAVLRVLGIRAHQLLRDLLRPRAPQNLMRDLDG